MKRTTIFVFALFFGYQAVFSQDVFESRTAITITRGFQDYRSQDLIFSPLIYHGSSFSFYRFSFLRETRSEVHRMVVSIHNLDIHSSESFNYLEGGNSVETGASNVETIGFQYGFARRVLIGQFLSLYLGGMIDGFFDFTDYQFGNIINDGTLISYSLSPWITGVLQFSHKRSLQVDITLPFLTWAGRSTFSVTDDERLKASSGFVHVTKNGQLEFLTTFTNFSLSISYRISLFKPIEGHIVYSFEYLSHEKPLQKNLLRNSLTAGFAYQF